MSSDQQNQALLYFRNRADQWLRFSDGREQRVNVSALRHNAVLHGCADLPPGARFLDVGCGAGQLVVEMARRGARASGIDFSPEMIAIAQGKSDEAGVKAEFKCHSIFELPSPAEPYDAISAQGFIEYISPAQMKEFFRLAAEYLAESGRFFLGSRNRLFNLASLNSYTDLELKLDVQRRLMEESIILASDRALKKALAEIASLPVLERHPERHPSTGIAVEARYQYTPGELIASLLPLGFEPLALYPVHYHAFPVPAMKSANWTVLHRIIAEEVSQLAPMDHRLVPRSSSFVLHLRKGGDR